MFDRRDMLAAGAAGAVLAALPVAGVAQDAVPDAEALIAGFTGGADVAEGAGVTLSTPEIAENGNTVPVSVEAPGAVELLLLAPDNPAPGVARFTFGPLAGSQRVDTRIRLARTQTVLAIAKMADGRFVKASHEVKVTIGGCGG